MQQMGSAAGQVFMTNAASARSSTGAEAELVLAGIGSGWQVQTGSPTTRVSEFPVTAPTTTPASADLCARHQRPLLPACAVMTRPPGWFLLRPVTVGAGKVYGLDAPTRRYEQAVGYAVIKPVGWLCGSAPN